MMNKSLINILAAVVISTPVLIAPAMVTPAAAQVELNVSIGVPPPAPVYEVVPVPRVGYVWAPGYYRWDGGRHVWIAGRWMEERRGYHWVPDRWARGDGGFRPIGRPHSGTIASARRPSRANWIRCGAAPFLWVGGPTFRNSPPTARGFPPAKPREKCSTPSRPSSHG